MTKLIDPNEIDFAATIKSLNPFAIDLSNVPDYLEKDSFIKSVSYTHLTLPTIYSV